MGNQSTSGIVEEAIATTPEKALEVSSSDNLRQENQILIQGDDIKDFHEKASSAAADSDDSAAEMSPPIERLTYGEKEEHKEPNIEDCETEAAVLLKGSNSEDRIPNFDNEVQDQPYSLKGEIQRSESNSNSNAITSSNLTPSPQEFVNITSEPQEDQNMLEKEIEETLELVSSYLVDDHGVEMNTQKEATNNDNIEKGTENEQRCLHTSQEEENSSIIALSELQSISLHGLSTSEIDEQNEGLALDEGQLMINGTCNVDQEINQFLICSNAQPETVICEIKKNEAEDAVEIDSLCCDRIKAEDQEDDKLTGELSATENCHQSETISVVTEAEMSPSMSNEQFSNTETPMLVRDSESKGVESTEKLDIGDQVELKKSPSFDFGLPFVAMPEESDQTPLLYQERPVIRSFSTSSTLIFQNRSVQTEVLGKSLRYESVEVEEKTIRMEGSKYESSGVSNVNLERKEVTIAKQEDCAVVVTSPKGNGKRKTKSSLFTACMCCTAAIS